jgi:hypothetical protein
MAHCGAAAMAAMMLAACAISSHQLIGTPRPPLSADQVQLYTETPARRFEQIAVLRASSKRAFALSYEAKAEVVVQRLKEEAAKVGANGVLLRGISDEPGASVGTNVGTNYEGPRGTIDVGVGTSTMLMSRYGSAIAIYVAPD